MERSDALYTKQGQEHPGTCCTSLAGGNHISRKKGYRTRLKGTLANNFWGPIYLQKTCKHSKHKNWFKHN